MRALAASIVLLTCACVCFAADTPAQPSQPATAPATAPAAAPAAEPAKSEEKPTAAAPAPAATPAPAPAPVPKPPALKPKKTLRTEAEFGALTSEVTSQFYTRLNLRQTGGNENWFLSASYYDTTSRSYTATSVYRSSVNTFRLDGQYRKDHNGSYRFVAATANIRDYPSTYGKSGYYLSSAGIGKQVLPGLESEIALAHVGTYDDVTEQQFTVISSLRWTNNLTGSLSMSGHAYLVRPFANDMLVDSRMDLTCKLNDVLSLRFSYIANNLLTPVASRSGWDRSFRVSLMFTHVR